MYRDKKYRLLYTDKAKQIVSRLSLEQKVDLMGGNITMNDMMILTQELESDDNHYNYEPFAAGGIEKEGVPPMLFCDGPRGVVCGTGRSTCFPVSVARGATFSTELEKQVGHAIGRETRAYGGNLFAGVCVNLPYHPGWGRSQETYGEESFAIGEMGAALARGVQEEDVIACVKHFAFNQMENARFKVDVSCDARTEAEVFLPHFKAVIDAGAASVMSSYNKYKAVHAGHNTYLLNQILKGEWDFDGFVMSDFIFGVKDTVEAANGGQDMEMCITQFFGERLVKAVRDGFVPEERIDDAAVRIVRTLLAFDDGHKEYEESVIGCREHTDLALRVAEEGITLLKNENVLPLPAGTVKKLALIGPLVNEAVTGDHGSSWVRPKYVVTPYQGMKAQYPDAEVICADGSDLDAAKKAAASADAVILVVGYNHDDEGEFISEDQDKNYTGAVGGDRKNGLALHEEDAALIKEVCPLNDRSVVVLIGGNTITMSDWFALPGAVIMAYYPGQEGGNALAHIVSGTVNPSGRLPFVVPVSEADLPTVDWEATDQYYEYYHGYARLDKNGVRPLIPYGYGLSYTSFEISEVNAVKEGDKLVARCLLSNTGEAAGKEVVQLYVGFSNSAVDRPVRILRGFCKVALAPGESKEVSIECPVEKLKYYDPVNREWVLESMSYEVYVGSSEALEDLTRVDVLL